MRDPNGIRPAFYYVDDEVIIAASERPVIQTAFNVGHKEVKELEPGCSLVIKKDGSIVQGTNVIDVHPVCLPENAFYELS